MRGCRPPSSSMSPWGQTCAPQLRVGSPGPCYKQTGRGPVGKAPSQAISKPTGEEPSGSPSNQGDSSGPQEGLVAIQTGPPQDNQEDHGSPNEGVEPVGSTPDGKGLESPDTVSIQWADTEVSSMDIGSLHLDEEGFRGGSPQKTKTRRTRPAHLPACGSTFPSGPKARFR
uniref:Filensin-like n=1 Tax=Crassostrea virginica TaxID=6565 RepID=A0A8B8B2J3_CRAVI|nr:filensin-like [Crassostrea virginica]